MKEQNGRSSDPKNFNWRITTEQKSVPKGIRLQEQCSSHPSRPGKCNQGK